MFKKSHDGKFASGKPLGTRPGSMKHDASTSAIKDRLHNDLNPSRKVTTTHADCPSVTDDLADVSAKGATDFGAGKGS
ncbi:MAG TPA: hypothetical protein VMQ54_11950 [Steroidobacteraceae bacterium]|nr:hypothetical protein [Steroidobacteraceae bacterium]